MDGVVIDLETTGLSPRNAAITEIAAVRLRQGEVVEVYSSLINPECHIPSFVTKITGIDDAMVKHAPCFSHIADEFLDFLGDDMFIAHNAAFDYGFLLHYLMACDKSLSNERLCTAKLARRLLAHLPRKRLGDVCTYFDIVNTRAHRATADALATSEVYVKLCALAAEHQLPDLGIVQKMPVEKVQLSMRSVYK